MFDNFYVNHHKKEGFLPYIPCILIPEYGQSNAPLDLQVSLEENGLTMQCVSHKIFYQRLDDFKQKQKRNTSQLTMFIEDQFILQ